MVKKRMLRIYIYHMGRLEKKMYVISKITLGKNPDHQKVVIKKNCKLEGVTKPTFLFHSQVCSSQPGYNYQTTKPTFLFHRCMLHPLGPCTLLQSGDYYQATKPTLLFHRCRLHPMGPHTLLQSGDYYQQLNLPCCFTGVGYIPWDSDTLLQSGYFFQQLQPLGQNVVHTSVPETQKWLMVIFLKKPSRYSFGTLECNFHLYSLNVSTKHHTSFFMIVFFTKRSRKGLSPRFHETFFC